VVLRFTFCLALSGLSSAFVMSQGSATLHPGLCCCALSGRQPLASLGEASWYHPLRADSRTQLTLWAKGWRTYLDWPFCRAPRGAELYQPGATPQDSEIWDELKGWKPALFWINGAGFQPLSKNIGLLSWGVAPGWYVSGLRPLNWRPIGFLMAVPSVSPVGNSQREAGGIRKPPRGRQVVDALKGRDKRWTAIPHITALSFLCRPYRALSN